jgi:hypothetical protein
MRIEGHGHCHTAALGSPAFHALDDLQMSAVKTVKVAKRQDWMHEPRRTGIVWVMENVHQRIGAL